MRRWAWVVVALYLGLFLALTVPVLLAGFWGAKDPHDVLAGALGVFRERGYWVWLAVAGAGQFLLLAVPVAAAEGRPARRGPVLALVVVSAFLLAALCAAGLLAAESGIWGDKVPLPAAWMPAVLAAAWLAWGFFFRGFDRSSPEALHSRLTAWLLRGSILELLVAVPSHVLARRRSECCADIFTFWGIAAGLSVMLMSFGPGVFYLFSNRAKRLRRES
jgi:hypothetical protein